MIHFGITHFHGHALVKMNFRCTEEDANAISARFGLSSWPSIMSGCYRLEGVMPSHKTGSLLDDIKRAKLVAQISKLNDQLEEFDSMRFDGLFTSDALESDNYNAPEHHCSDPDELPF